MFSWKKHNRWLILVVTVHICIGCGSNGKDQTDWQFASQRKEIAPEYAIDHSRQYRGAPSLYLSGGGKEYANGCWYRTVEVSPTIHYVFRASFLTTNVEEPARSVLARVLWYDAEGMQIGQAEYPATVDSLAQDRWAVIRQGYTAPAQAATARLELVYRWDADGAVYFGGVSFRPETRDPSRRIKLATVYHRPENTAGVLDNLRAFAPLLERAAEGGADIICMPEGINLVGTGMDYVSASEEIPGRATDFLGKIAARHACYIVAGLFERDGPIVYNTAVLIDRSGAVAGKYRKVSLPREEIEGGITPGDRLPVFETDFGTIGMMICWDVTFPEVARNLASKGAEVILMPIWGGNITLTRARAIENQVFLVTSGYDIRTAIFDKEGEVLAEATRDTPVAVFEVDLNQRLLWPWLGDLRNRIPREKPSARVLYPDGGYDQ